MNNNEISKLSYTDKDFVSMYPEVLNLAKQLTNKWDPSQSNESDPGVVLLKEGAFMVDHTNYNIDKNVLENFLPSATQDRSVRNICEVNGYTPRYYISGEGYVTFNYKNEDDTNTNGYSIPAFTLVISDADQTISYTQVEELSLVGSDNKSLSGVCKFVEGTLNTLVINDSSTILLENLDDNNRLYLPETMIAQNGIFVKYANDTEGYGFWERNNYLLTQPSGSRMYKIDYDSLKGLPYIEFPSDIASIIEDGLIISYISTSGSAGNVSANVLNTITTPSEFKIGDIDLVSNLTVSNGSSIVNGKDPETIDEMYKSFKKVVGTFETLVSCKDYSNYINIILDGNNSKLISNCYVADRRTDYNKAQNVVTFDTSGTFLKNISIKDSKLQFKGVVTDLPTSATIGDIYAKGDKLYIYNSVRFIETSSINLNDFAILTKAITPYDLVIYALKAFSIADFNNLLPYASMENSFKPIIKSTLSEIKSDIENIKCICHTYNDPSFVEDNKDVYCFKNYVPLTVTITPFNKITSEQESEILLNVYKHISEKLNSSEIEFGEKIEKETIKDVILGSDERIKSVDVSYDSYLKAMNGNGQEFDLSNTGHYTGSTLMLELIAKNILAGRVCLFSFDNNFNLDYGQVVDKIYDNVSSVTTELPIKIEMVAESNVKTSKTTTTTSTIKCDGTDSYKYCFNAPNLVTDDGNRTNVQQSMTYTLQSENGNVDMFVYSSKDIKGNITTTTLKAGTLNTYKISFSGGEIKNTADRKVKYEIPKGNLVIEEITVDSSAESAGINVDYTLKENECVQIIYPNYYSENTFGMYVNYRYQGTNIIRANEEHTLVGDEKLIFLYTKDSVEQKKVLSAGTIIKSSFDLKPTDSVTNNGTSKTWTDSNGVTHSNDKFLTLSSNQTISERLMMKTVLDSSNKCYWIINSAEDGKSNRLFEPGKTEKILGSDDYFVYANDTLDEIYILGAGTLLTRTDSKDSQWLIDTNDYTIKNISTNGTAAAIPWQRINFSEYPMSIIEMNVVTLGVNDTLKITGWTGTSIDDYIGNDWRVCKGNIIYTCSSDDQVILPKVSGDFYRIKSRLDLICSTINPQQLRFTTVSATSEGTPTKVNGVQTLVINDTEGHETKYQPYDNGVIKHYKIQTSKEVSIIGGKKVKLDKIYEKQPGVYIYTDGEKITFHNCDGTTKEGSRTIVVDYNKSMIGTQSYSQDFPFSYDGSKMTQYNGYLIPIYIENNEVDVKCTVHKDSPTGDKLDIELYNSGKTPVKEIILKGNDTNFLHLRDSYNGLVYLVLEWTVPGPIINPETIIVGDIKIIKGLNDKISIDTTNITLAKVLNVIDHILTESDQDNIRYYYTYEPDEDMKINLDKYMHKNILKSAALGYDYYDSKAFDNVDIMWDKNNIANLLTIQQIDLRNSNMQVDPDMVEN